MAEKKLIYEECKALKNHQEQVQDQNVLPTLTLADIPRNIEFTDSETRYIGKVKT